MVESKSYFYDEVLESATKYFRGDALAAQVWVNKYALKSPSNYVELNPDDMHKRLSSEINRVDSKFKNPLGFELIYGLLKDFKYLIPQGGPMTGIGNIYQLSSLSNCFVIGNKGDSYGGIMNTDEEQVQLMKRRGGVGHDLSHLRTDGSPTTNAAGSATGVASFMHRYSNSTREVAQNGRRGALMLSLSIKHPDARKFISIKNDEVSVTGANISVKIDDEFMNCVKSGLSYTQQFPIDSPNPTVTCEVNAREIWKEIIHNAWSRAEPGVLFWDTVINESIPDCYSDLGFGTTSTNPCGEIPLCPYDSCRLLAINLYNYVNKPFTPQATFDFTLFEQHAKYAMVIMDDIIELEIEKIQAIIDKIESDPEVEDLKRVELDLWHNIMQKCVQGRRTGVGITAMGDMLAAMGYKYGTPEATAFATMVHKTLAISAYSSSVELAKDRGAFPIFDSQREKDNPFLNRLLENEPQLAADMVKYGRRNIALLTIAPTGTTSMMAQTTSGIEPVFLPYYGRRTKVNPGDPNSRVDFVDEVGDSWMENKVFHHKFIDWYSVKSNISREEADVELSLMDNKSVDEEFKNSPYYGATANDVDWKEKVNMQGSIQKWVDHSISVTVNIPNEATEELVDTIYMTGWESGCKGMTVYRDGCRSGVLVSTNEIENKTTSSTFVENNAPKRPKELTAKVLRFQNNYETWIGFVGLMDGKPYEIFTGKTNRSMRVPTGAEGFIVKSKDENGSGKYDFKWIEDGKIEVLENIHKLVDLEFYNYGKLLSGILRHGMPIPYIVDIISGLHFEEDHISTWKNGILRAIKQFIPDGDKSTDSKCTSCGDPDGLVFKEGCLTCKSCGYSKCG